MKKLDSILKNNMIQKNSKQKVSLIEFILLDNLSFHVWFMSFGEGVKWQI